MADTDDLIEQAQRWQSLYRDIDCGGSGGRLLVEAAPLMADLADALAAVRARLEIERDEARTRAIEDTMAAQPVTIRRYCTNCMAVIDIALPHPVRPPEAADG